MLIVDCQQSFFVRLVTPLHNLTFPHFHGKRGQIVLTSFRFNEQKAISLRHRIADEIRQAILAGKLKPGDRLIEVEISKQMGVSRGPIREALRVLEQEGLLHSQPFKETVVAEFSTEEIVEVLLPIRVTIELFAVRKGLERMTGDDFKALEGYVEGMKAGGAEGDLMKVVENDLSFHDHLVRMSNLTSLLSVWSSIFNRIRVHFIYQDIVYEDISEVWKQHQAILDAMDSRDPAIVCAELNRHIYDANVTTLGKR
jgi:DNA-binding GntR family transcriptional regulator